MFFLYVIPFLCALLTSDVQFKAVVKKKEQQQTFPVDIEVKVTISCKLCLHETLGPVA